MDEIVEKANRLRRVKTVSVDLRPEVFEAIASAAIGLGVATSTFVRGIIEDFYDQYLTDGNEVLEDV